MKLLAIETTAPVATVALWRDGEVTRYSADDTKKHAETVLPLVERLLAETGETLSAMDYFAVDIGPGSFTGVRIGVCIANAFGYAMQNPVIGCNALETLREALRGVSESVCTMIDARNGNAYAALYEGENVLLEPKAVVVAEYLDRLPGNVRFVGDVPGLAQSDPASARYPDAGALARLAARRTERAQARALPLYLRASQAERLHKREA